MNGTDNLGGAYLQVGANINPLIQNMQAGQRVVNTTMQRMGTSVQRFSLDIGKGLGKAFGFAGFVGAAGTMAMGTREAIKQLDAQKRLAVAVGTTWGNYRKMSQAVAEYTETAKRSYAITRAQAMDLASLLIKQGKFSGDSLKQAYEASLGLSTLGGVSPQEAAQFLIGAKFGQPAGSERFGMHFAQGGPGGAHLEEIMAGGRRGLGIQRELARLPQEVGRRALVNALDRVAENIAKLIDRFGVLDDMFKARPEGAPGILEPGESPMSRAAADVVDAKIGFFDRWSNRMRAVSRFAIYGALGPTFGSEGAANIAATLTDPMRNSPTHWWRWLGRATEAPEQAIRSSLDQLDEATSPDPFKQADVLERAAAGISGSHEAGLGGTPEQRAAQGGAGPYLQTPLEDNTKALNSLTDALHSTGGLQ